MKKEQQERLARRSDLSDGYSGYTPSAPSSPLRKAPGTGYAGDYDDYRGSIPGPQRGGYSRGRGGSAGYHPYQRPAPYVAPRFRNKTVIFNKADSSDETLEAKKAVTLTTDSTHSEGHQQQIEPQTLCPAFTLTGTPRAVVLTTFLTSYV